MLKSGIRKSGDDDNEIVFVSGKHVNQYHEERGKERVVINLGKFDGQKHLEWVKERPATRKLKPLATRKTINHLYSDGDVCDITG